MSISEPFIKRPVGTTLLTVALGLSGAAVYNFLPVAPLPQVDFPSIQVSAGLPGASPETMASAVASPLERQFGRIAGINEMTSSSTLGSTAITLQFDLNRNIDAAARDVQAGINAARGQLPANLPRNPFWRKVNPADSPILELGLTSSTLSPGHDGHLRLKGAIAEKMREVPVIPCDGWTDAQVKAFRLMVNRSVTWAEWDTDALALEFLELKALDFDLSLTGFNSREIDEFTLTPNSAEVDLWLCGPHRILCGDATCGADVARLLDGRKPFLMITDPPYGIELDSEWRDRAGLNGHGPAEPSYAGG
jgi:hypothetical protein